jgi:hypothetical protein
VATEIVPMGPANWPAVRRFAAATWPERVQSDAFLRWRYDECPVLRGYLALRDGECLAMVTALARPYRVGGVTREVRESFDWYCLPRYRGSGLGVRVLRRLMEDPEPVVVIGGSADTRELLPKLGFQVPDALVPYTLPLGPGRLSEVLAERAKIPPLLTRAGFALLRPLVAPRRRPRSDGARALAVSGLGPEIEALYRAGRYGVVPEWRVPMLRWFGAGFPGIGQVVSLYFVRGEALLGFSLLRIHPTPSGSAAQLVDLFAPQPDVELFRWMVSETACVAAGFAADVLTAFSTSPELGLALRRNRFRRGEALPIHWYDRAQQALPAPLFFGGQWGDIPLRPFPSRWWDAGTPD